MTWSQLITSKISSFDAEAVIGIESVKIVMTILYYACLDANMQHKIMFIKGKRWKRINYLICELIIHKCKMPSGAAIHR